MRTTTVLFLLGIFLFTIITITSTCYVNAFDAIPLPGQPETKPIVDGINTTLIVSTASSEIICENLHTPTSVLVVESDVIVVDSGAHTIGIASRSGIVQVLAGISGTVGNASIPFKQSILGNSAALNSPYSIVLNNSNGDLFFTDTNNHFIKKLTWSNKYMENVVGNGQYQVLSESATYNSREIPLTTPKGLAFHSANNTLYLGNGAMIFKVTFDDEQTTKLEIANDANFNSNAAGFKGVVSLSLTSNGQFLYICDSDSFENRRLIKRYDTITKTLETVVGTVDGFSNDKSTNPLSHTLNDPRAVAVSPDGTRVYIADGTEIKVLLVEQNTITTLHTASTPTGLFVHPNGTVYFTDSGAKQVVKFNVTTCTAYSSDPQCLTSCNGISSNNSILVCSGQGVCTKSDTCQCRTGFTGNWCQYNSTLTITPVQSTVTVVAGEVALLGATVSESAASTSYYWDCVGLNNFTYVSPNQNFLSYNTTHDQVGNWTFTVYAAQFQSGAMIRQSKPAAILVIILPNNNHTSNNSTHITFESKPIITDIIQTLYLFQNQKIDSVLTGFNIDSDRFLKLISQDNRASSTMLSISWQLVYQEKVHLSSDQPITTRAVVTKNANYTNLSIQPFINVHGNVRLEGDVSTVATLSFTISSTSANQNNMVINHILSFKKPIGRISGIPIAVNISPTIGMGLSTLFTFNENSTNWSFPTNETLSFAIGIVYNNKTVQLTDFVQMDTPLSTYLPFTKHMENDKLTPLVLFVKDHSSNVQSFSVDSSVTMLRNNQTISQVINALKTDGRIGTVLPYDSSFPETTDGYDQLVSLAMQNVSIAVENPSLTLSSLHSMSEKNTTSFSNLILQVIDTFIDKVGASYKNQKNQLGFVTSKVSDDDMKTVLSTASNLASKASSADGSGMLVATKLSSLLILSSIPILIGSNSANNSLPTSTMTSSNIDISFTSFLKESASPSSSFTTRFNSVVELDADSILSQYSAFSSEIGVSLVSFGGIVYNSEQNSISATNAKDFTMYRNGTHMSLKNLNKPFSIAFNSNASLMNSNRTIICKYWNETLLQWATNGCQLKSFNNVTGEIICDCTHTTLFSAFIENVIPGSIYQAYVDQFIGIYGTHIALGSIYLICASIILVALIFNGKKQPVKSRFVTPYIGMIALIIQSALHLIVQRSILLSAIQQRDVNGALASNIVSNIITIIVNTVTLCTIMTYLYQVLRFEFLKYFYNELYLMKEKITSSRLLHFIKQLISAKVYCIFILGFALVNIAYWTLWVILVRTEAISGMAYTQIVSISYTIAILFIGFVICCVFAVDTIMTWYQRNQFKVEPTTTTTSTAATTANNQKLKHQNILKKIVSFLFDWFVRADTPLFFRVEMILFVISFASLVVVQALGMASLNYRLLLDPQTTVQSAPPPLVVVRTIVTYDSISIVFEVLHIVTYLFVYGGYALIMSFIQRMRWLRVENNEQEKDEVHEHLENPHFVQIFDKFCRKEFSLENLQLYLLLNKNSDITQKDLSQVIDFMNTVYDEYIKSGAMREVNIPSDCRKSFAQMVDKLKNADSLELVDEKNTMAQTKKNTLPANLSDLILDNLKSLTDQVLINLSDTFSRFYNTPEFEEYSNSTNAKEDLMKQANLM